MKNDSNIKYYSQFEQDKFLDQQVLKGKKQGFFVEIGAYDGIKLSNTYFFEKHRGWDGICIEPIPKQYALLQKNRTCHCVKGCVSNKKGNDIFLHILGGDKYIFVHRETEDRVVGKEHTEMLSGLMRHYHPKHQELIKKEIAELKVDFNELEVQCHLLNDILDNKQITRIDYLSIDTEGTELCILKSIDFNKYDIDVISIEVLYPDVPVRSFMEEQGYSLVKKCGYDDIYQKNR